MTGIFISYSHKDFKFADTLKKRLQDAGYKDIWLDRESIEAGADWNDAIDKGIKNSFVVLVILSKDSAESHYVTYEWAYALGQGKNVIPLLLEDIEIHSRLSKLQIKDFRQKKQGLRIWKGLANELHRLKYDAETEDIQLPDNPSDEIIRLIRDLNAPDADGRKKAVDALGKHKDDYSVKFLTQIVKQDRSDEVRKAAVKSLSKINTPAAKTAVISVLHEDPEAYVRKAAATFLKKMGRGNQKGHIKSALEKAMKDTSKVVKDEATKSLAAMNTP